MNIKIWEDDKVLGNISGIESHPHAGEILDFENGRSFIVRAVNHSFVNTEGNVYDHTVEVSVEDRVQVTASEDPPSEEETHRMIQLARKHYAEEVVNKNAHIDLDVPFVTIADAESGGLLVYTPHRVVTPKIREALES